MKASEAGDLKAGERVIDGICRVIREQPLLLSKQIDWELGIGVGVTRVTLHRHGLTLAALRAQRIKELLSREEELLNLLNHQAYYGH